MRTAVRHSLEGWRSKSSGLLQGLRVAWQHTTPLLVDLEGWYASLLRFYAGLFAEAIQLILLRPANTRFADALRALLAFHITVQDPPDTVPADVQRFGKFAMAEAVRP